MTTRPMCRWMLPAIASICLASPASAGIFTMTDSLRAHSKIDGYGPLEQPAQVVDVLPQSWSFGTSLSDSGMSAVATNAGFVDYGTVKMRLFAEAGRDHFEPGCPPGLQGGPNCEQYGSHYVSAGTEGFAMWQDYVVLTSDTLPVGTPVDVEVGYLMRSIVASSPGGAWCSQGGGAWIRGFANAQFVGRWNFLHDDCGNGSETMYGTAVGHLKIGDGFTINAGLEEAVLAISTSWALTNSELADAGNTSVFSIKVLTPDASYVSTSGTRYLADLPVGQVPEPGSALLLGLGVVALVAARRARGGASPRPEPGRRATTRAVHGPARWGACLPR